MSAENVPQLPDDPNHLATQSAISMPLVALVLACTRDTDSLLELAIERRIPRPGRPDAWLVAQRARAAAEIVRARLDARRTDPDPTPDVGDVVLLIQRINGLAAEEAPPHVPGEELRAIAEWSTRAALGARGAAGMAAALRAALTSPTPRDTGWTLGERERVGLTLLALQKGRLGPHRVARPPEVGEAARWAQKAYLGLYERTKRAPSATAAPHLDARRLAQLLEEAELAYDRWRAAALTDDQLKPWLHGILCACCIDRLLRAVSPPSQQHVAPDEGDRRPPPRWRGR